MSFEKLLQAVAFGSTDPDVLSSLAGRLARLDRQLGQRGARALAEAAGGQTLQAIAAGLVDALDPDRQIEAARQAARRPMPSRRRAGRGGGCSGCWRPTAPTRPCGSCSSRSKQRYEQTIDTVSKDEVLEAGYSEAATRAGAGAGRSFEQFIREHKDEITALQVLYSRPYAPAAAASRTSRRWPQAIQAPPRSWTPELLWQAYETLDASRVRGSGGRVLTDLVSLVRFALQQDDALVPFPDRWRSASRPGWRSRSSRAAVHDEQRQWLEMIRDHVAASLGIEMDDSTTRRSRSGAGWGRRIRCSGSELGPLLDELTGCWRRERGAASRPASRLG